MQRVGPQPDIFSHCHSWEEAVALRHLHNTHRQYLTRHQACDGTTIKGDPTQTGLQEAAKNAQDGGFASAVRSNYTGSGALLYLQADALKHVAAIIPGINIL